MSIWRQTAKKWPSEVVAQEAVKDFTGGLYDSKTISNLCSRGSGPPKYKHGRKAYFYAVELAEWLTARESAK